MAEAVWINGEFVEREAARVSAFDAGLLHGVGLFETMLASRGRVFALERHLARLEGSARDLGLSERLRVAALTEAVRRVVAESGLAADGGRARVRLTLTGGDLNLLEREARSQTDPTMVGGYFGSSGVCW